MFIWEDNLTHSDPFYPVYWLIGVQVELYERNMAQILRRMPTRWKVHPLHLIAGLTQSIDRIYCVCHLPSSCLSLCPQSPIFRIRCQSWLKKKITQNTTFYGFSFIVVVFFNINNLYNIYIAYLHKYLPVWIKLHVVAVQATAFYLWAL